MNRLTVSIVLSTIALCSGALVKPSQEGHFELLILHNNDMHARFEQTSRLSGACTLADREAGQCYGGFPRVAHVVKEARRDAQTGQGPPVLYLNAGDTYTGTAWFTIYKWKIAAEFLNALQPDAVSLGNHEFDNGVSGLTPFIENLRSPVLCANLILTKVPELSSEANLKKSITLDIDGHKVGIVGYLTPETKVIAKPNDVEYIDEVVALREEVKKFQDQGIKIIIALGHSGYKRDQEIARDVEGLDIVIGGHTNTFLWNGTIPDTEYAEGPYPTYVTQASGRRVPVVQAYAYTKYLGKLHLTFDNDGEIIEADGSPILLNQSIPQDPQVLRVLNKFNDTLLSSTQVIVGNTSITLSSEACSYQECNFGNLITDSMVERYASDYKGEHWTDAPIAFIQAGSIRTSISHTTITKGDLLSVMPFEGNLTAVTMNGSVLLQALEVSAAGYDTDFRVKFLQFSGLKVVYNMKMPAGFRVVSAKARCWMCSVPSFTEVDKKSFYKVIMPTFLANGGDGFSMLVGLESQPLGYSELGSTEYYVRHHSPVFAQIEDRITLVNEDSLGNHEFDNQVEGLIPFIRTLSSPVLAANLILDKVPALNQETNLRKSIVLERDGFKIGIIGYLTAETKFLAPKNDVEYEDEVIALRREVENLKRQGVHIFIALGHSGFTKDLQIARDVEDLDLVIGGHSNTFLWNSPSTNETPERVEGPYPVEVKQPSGRIVRVVQAYAYTKYLGSLNLIFDQYGEIVHCEGNPILLHQQMPGDPELLKIVEKYSSEIDRINNVVVGNSSVALHGEYCRIRECNMGVVITDAIVNYTKEHSDRYRDVNIAIVQGGRIRTSIDRPQKPYEMTRGDWVTVLPFTDTLTVVTMNGSILLESLEHSVYNWKATDSPGQFLQFSGMRVVYDLAKPSGSRVVSAKALDSNTGELSDILEGNEYRVIMCLFLAEGGDGFSKFEKLPKDILSYNEVDSVIYYLSKIGILTQGDTGRVTVLNTDKVTELQVQYHTNAINSSIQILSSINLGMFCILAILSYFASEIYI